VNPRIRHSTGGKSALTSHHAKPSTAGNEFESAMNPVRIRIA
jgi:hypothetical protein